MRLLPILALLCCAAVAQAGELEITVTGPDSNGNIRGRRARVAVAPATAPVMALEVLAESGVDTSDDGKASLESPAVPSVVLARADASGIVAVRIPAGETRASIELPAGVVLRGIVVDPDGEAISGARLLVAVERPRVTGPFLGPGEVGLATTSDAMGNFRVEGLVRGRRYRVRAAAVDHAVGTLRDVLPPPAGFAITLSAGATVHGHVIAIPGGKPLAGANVEIGDRTSKTGEDGSFVLRGITPGKTTARVAADGFQNAKKVELVLKDGEIREGLFLRALALGGIKGRILTAATRPAPGAELLLRYPPGTGLDDRLPADRIVRGGRSGEKGVFEIKNLLPAQGVDLIVRHPDHSPTVHLGYSISAGRMVSTIVLLRDGGRISGRVIDNQGLGLAGVRVVALDDREDPSRLLETGRPLFPTSREGVTDEAGSYTVLHVPAGRRTLVAMGADLLPAVERGVEVGEGTHRKNVILLVGEGTRLAGIVRDPEGRPVPDATVTAAASLGLRYRTTSGPDGTFSFEGLPEGAYVIEAAADGFTPADPMRVKAPALELSIVLTPGAGLSGQVLLEETREPVHPATVRVLRRGQPSPLLPDDPVYETVREVRAEPPEGRFAAGNLPVGDYRIEAWSDDGQYGYLDGIRIAEGERPEPVRVRVSAGWSIRGRVVDGRSGLPLEGATVALRTGVDQPGPHRASTDGQGNYRIDGVSVGFHTLVVVARDLAPEIVRSVEVKNAADTMLEDITLRPGSTVSGTVTGPDGSPRAGVRLSLESAELRGKREDRTDEQGRFSFENVAAGPYLLVADEGFSGQFKRRYERLIVVKAGKDLNISLGTGRGSVLMGRITSSGAPVPHAPVAALLATSGLKDRRQVVSTRTDADGNYVFTDLPAGDHLLTVTLPWSGGNPVRFGVRVLPGPVTLFDPILPDSGIDGLTFDLDTGDALPGVLIRLTREAGGAEGTFLAALTREMGEVASGKSGTFRFPALPPGDYRIECFRDGYGQAGLGAIRVHPGGFTPVRIELPPAGTLAGRVVDERNRPVTTARVRFLDMTGEVVTRRPWYPVDSEGRFSMRELKTGTYTVEATAPGFARAEVAEADVFPGGGVEVTLLLKIEGRLEITVYGEGGKVLAGVRISIVDFWGRPIDFPNPKVGELTPFTDPSRTGDDGRLLLQNLPPGVYTVTATLPGHVGVPVRMRVLDGELSRGAVVLLPVR